MKLSLQKDLAGPILDLGGGGEGVIGLIYGGQVTAIDNRQEELDEAPEGPVKLVMDAAALAFADGSFQTVTAFFSLMYMDRATQGGLSGRPPGAAPRWAASPLGRGDRIRLAHPFSHRPGH